MTYFEYVLCACIIRGAFLGTNDTCVTLCRYKGFIKICSCKLDYFYLVARMDLKNCDNEHVVLDDFFNHIGNW